MNNCKHVHFFSVFAVPIFPREISRNFPRKKPYLKIGGMKGWVITGSWGMGVQVKGLELQRRKDVVEKNSAGTMGVLRVVKDGSWQVIFFVWGGWGWGDLFVPCFFGVVFWVTYPTGLLGITMKLIRVSPY